MSSKYRAQVTRFPQKLWEAATFNEDGTIFWSTSGNSIIFRFDFMKNQFAPDGNLLFKTDSLPKFIHLLNTYGFRKVKMSERDLKSRISGQLYLEYSMQFFKKGRPELLIMIERRSRKTCCVKKPKVVIDVVKELEERLSGSNNLEYREKVIKYKLDIVETARKNLSNLLEESLKAYKSGNKENFQPEQPVTEEDIINLCETREETVVRFSTRRVILRKSESENTWFLVDVPVQKSSRLVGDWNCVPIPSASCLQQIFLDQEIDNVHEIETQPN